MVPNTETCGKVLATIALAQGALAFHPNRVPAACSTPLAF